MSSTFGVTPGLQYSITIQMEADPQPFSSCFTKGTSIQSACCKLSNRASQRTIVLTLHEDQHDDRRGQRNCDVSQLLVCESAACEVLLDLIRLYCQTVEFFGRQGRECFIDLLVV